MGGQLAAQRQVDATQKPIHISQQQKDRHPIVEGFKRFAIKDPKEKTGEKEEAHKTKREIVGNTSGEMSQAAIVAVGGAVMTGLGIATAVAATTYYKAIEAAIGVVQYTYLFQGALLLLSGFMLAMGAYGFWLGYKEARRTKWK